MNYIIVGLLASFIPINIIGINNNVKLRHLVLYTPIGLAIFNLLYLSIITKFTDNYWFIGFLASIFISSFGRFIMRIPQDILEMQNPNMFHLYALIIWSLYYGIIGKFIISKCD